MIIRCKGCPRCGGDLCLDQDIFGKYFDCAQCGQLIYLVSPPVGAENRSVANRETGPSPEDKALAKVA